MEIQLQNPDIKTIVPIEFYTEINKYKWYKANGYAKSLICNKNVLLHRYIWLVLLNNNIPKGYVIDHIDNNRLNNEISNLRILTRSENARNRIKKTDSTSKFYGVSFRKTKNEWVAQITYLGVKKIVRYKIEEHAAYQYNLWCIEYNLLGAKLNDIRMPDDFILYEKPAKLLPKGVIFDGINFRVTVYKNKIRNYIGLFKTKEDAIMANKKFRDDFDYKISTECRATPILRNKDNIAIINNKILVDDDIYYDLIQFTWSVNSTTGYFNTQIKNTKFLLHRFIMKYDGENYVDHINNNKYDNRKENLRIVTVQQNAMNKSSAKNSTSKYIGVSRSRKKWSAKISVEKKNLNLGVFDNEEDAARARDIATIKYYGEYGNLNFPLKD